MASGHAMFHIAFFFGSLIAIKEVKMGKDEIKDLRDDMDITQLIVLVRIVHLFVASTQLF